MKLPKGTIALTLAIFIFLSFASAKVGYGDIIDNAPCISCKCGSFDGKNIACSNCQLYNSDWCQCNEDKKDICINDAIYELCTHKDHVMHVRKWHINEQQIGKLKAEVAELRATVASYAKMIEGKKEISEVQEERCCRMAFDMCPYDMTTGLNYSNKGTGPCRINCQCGCQ